MKKLIIKINIILVCIVLFSSGCIKTNEGLSNSSDKQQDVIEKNEENNDSSSNISIPKNNQFVISESEKISSWKKLNAKVHLSRFEMGNGDMSWQVIEDSNMVNFSFDYPENWEFNNSSVFMINENSKAAELFPVASGSINIDDLFRDYKPSEDFGEELINKEKVIINGYECMKVITKVDLEYGERPFWYPHTYFISNNNYLLGISFYSYEINENDQKVFDEIVNTFSFD